MPGGRPPFFTNPEDMQEKIDAYFSGCVRDETPPTISGLALAIGFANRKSLLDYDAKDEFSNTIKRAKARVEESIEAGLMRGYNATGAIFNLKNNFGWVDKTESERYGKDGGPEQHKWTVEFINAPSDGKQ